MFQPEVLSVHHGADFGAVTAGNPARRGETLILRARSLGPVRGLFNYGEPFPLNAVQIVNSPVDVQVNGRASEVVNQIGWPGETDVYRVDFRVPDSAASGMNRLRLNSAWIPAPQVMFPVQ